MWSQELKLKSSTFEGKQLIKDVDELGHIVDHIKTIIPEDDVHRDQIEKLCKAAACWIAHYQRTKHPHKLGNSQPDKAAKIALVKELKATYLEKRGGVPNGVRQSTERPKTRTKSNKARLER